MRNYLSEAMDLLREELPPVVVPQREHLWALRDYYWRKLDKAHASRQPLLARIEVLKTELAERPYFHV